MVKKVVGKKKTRKASAAQEAVDKFTEELTGMGARPKSEKGNPARDNRPPLAADDENELFVPCHCTLAWGLIFLGLILIAAFGSHLPHPSIPWSVYFGELFDLEGDNE